jgi:hypothetical protein
MEINGVAATFHHLGIPTIEKKPGERFSPQLGLHTSDSPCKSLRIQYHRFEPDSPMPKLIQQVPHLAFKVDDLERAIAGCTVVFGPFEPIVNYRIVIIEDGGQPIELVQTTLTDEQIWARAATENTMYQDDPGGTSPPNSLSTL